MNTKMTDKLATGLFTAIAGIIIAILAGLLGYIFYKGFGVISFDFLTNPPSSFRAGGGIGPQLFNSFYILFLTMVFTVPLGIGGGTLFVHVSKYLHRYHLSLLGCLDYYFSFPSQDGVIQLSVELLL
jgi:phosphate transport system permease protein